jgi:hypothetical protein
MPDVVPGITVEHEMGTAQIDAPERDQRGRIAASSRPARRVRGSGARFVRFTFARVETVT